jgi:GT2 family glycosyltransferase
MINIDIIILSNGKSERLIDLTKQTIHSLLESEDCSIIKFDILVLESCKSIKPYEYPNAKTIYPETEFGFHKYLNIGLNETSNDLVCFCNNDLIFHKGWASAILKSMQDESALESVGVFCPNFHVDKLDQIPDDINYGYKNGVLFTGWCFLVKRSVFNKVGKFDEKFNFWFADDDFRLSLEKHAIKHGLIKNARVTHIRSETLSTEKSRSQFKLQESAKAYYNYKWRHHNKLIFIAAKIKYYLRLILKAY